MAVKIFQRNQRSLFGEILDWMLTPLLLLWPISLALTWLVAQNLANKPFDRALVYNAQALAQKMCVFIEQPELIASRGQASRRLAQDRFDVHQVNERLIALILQAD